MNRVKTFEEMGREADHANRDFAMAQSYLSEVSEDVMKARISVVIARASWGDGSLPLQAAFTAVVQDRAAELLHEALTSLHQQGEAATKALRAAFDAGPAPVEVSRQVPRGEPEPLRVNHSGAGLEPGQLEEAALAERRAAEAPGQTAAPLTPAESGNREAPLPGIAQSRQDSHQVDPRSVAWNALARQAQELMIWCQQNPGTRFAKTASRDELVRLGYLASSGAGQNATWTLTAQGLSILPPSA